MDQKLLWQSLKAGTVFRFDNKFYLRTKHGILSMEDYTEVGLHNDVTVQPVGSFRNDGFQLRFYHEW